MEDIRNLDTNIIEKNFRDARKIYVPDSLNVKKKGRHGNIDNMRLILKYWHNIQKIPRNILAGKQIYTLRGYVNNFLKGDKSKCPKSYHAIIEEYQSFIVDGHPNEDLLVTKSKSNDKKVVKMSINSKSLESWICFLKEQGVSEFSIKF